MRRLHGRATRGLVAAVALAFSCGERESFSADHADVSDRLACLGDAVSFASSRRVPYVDLAPRDGAPRARVLVDSGTTFTTIDPVARAGILGTDRTSRGGLAVDYARGAVRRAAQGAFCSEGELSAAGLSALPATGFFTNDLSKLRPLADVSRAGRPGLRVANVPTVPLRVGGVTAHAQIDTGFDDSRVPFSVNVNEALFAAIASESPGALVRAPEKDVLLTTCAGVSEPAVAYGVVPGASVELVDRHGRAVRAFSGATLFVKRTPEAARRCGGIGTWSAPAAQIGASFLLELGLVVFDPFRSLVWVR